MSQCPLVQLERPWGPCRGESDLEIPAIFGIALRATSHRVRQNRVCQPEPDGLIEPGPLGLRKPCAELESTISQKRLRPAFRLPGRGLRHIQRSKGRFDLLRSHRFLGIILFTHVLGCGSSDGAATAERWLVDPDTALPPKLSSVGVFDDMRTRTPYDDIVGYAPKHALFSNGLTKERHVYLAEGTQIDAKGVDEWDFPEGTVLFKTFLWKEAPIETRLLFKNSEGWDYAIYQWSDDGRDAELLPGNWAEVPVELEDGELIHTLPSRLDCRTCHETHEERAGVPVLGVSSLQTDDDLTEANVFDRPPVLEEVQGRTPEETAALGYFIGNCTACHNGGNALNSSFSLYPEDAVANTVDQPTETETGEGIRVVPGSPEQSVLFITVVDAPVPGYRGPFKAMPPLGLSVVDPDAQAILSTWIEGL